MNQSASSNSNGNSNGNSSETANSAAKLKSPAESKTAKVNRPSAHSFWAKTMSSDSFRTTQNKIVAPSLLSADFANLESEIAKVKSAGAEWIHVDVMDGHFVPNLTLGPPVIRSVEKVSGLLLDVHLMIDAPERYIQDFAKAGSDIITFHIEATKNPGHCIELIRNQGKKVGLTLRPKTSLDSVLPFLKDVDLILIMTVEPGFGGQSFMSDQVIKIQRIREEIKKNNYPILIEVDGGINESTSRQCAEVDIFVAGNYIFGGDYQKAIQQLRDV